MIARVRPQVLIAEDDEDMRFVLRHNLEADGLTVRTAEDGETALAVARETRPDLLILDVMLPGMDGYRVLRLLRAEGYERPVLLLTARSSEPEKVYGLRSGADDYVTKPFGLQELLARVAVLLRRAARQDGHEAMPSIRLGQIEIDPSVRAVRRGGEEVPLTPRAYELLLALCARRNTVVTRQELMQNVWGYADGATSRTLDAHVAELRRKLEDDPRNPRHIHTVWRVGYRVND